MTTNLFPQYEKAITKEEKEKLIRQKGLVIWFTGLSGSGKSTLGFAIVRELYNRGYLTQILDGDIIRKGINNNLGFSIEDRNENIRRISEVARLFASCGLITICSFISPTVEIRQMARGIIGNEHFFEIFLSTSLEVCEERDTKGLYKKARAGLIDDFTGISSPYESPLKPNLTIDTAALSIQESVSKILESILPLVANGK